MAFIKGLFDFSRHVVGYGGQSRIVMWNTHVAFDKMTLSRDGITGAKFGHQLFLGLFALGVIQKVSQFSRRSLVSQFKQEGIFIVLVV